MRHDLALIDEQKSTAEPPAEVEVRESLLESMASISVVLVIKLFVMTFIFQNFEIPSASMVETPFGHITISREAGIRSFTDFPRDLEGISASASANHAATLAAELPSRIQDNDLVVPDGIVFAMGDNRLASLTAASGVSFRLRTSFSPGWHYENHRLVPHPKIDQISSLIPLPA
jgi:hypothetical protein